MSASRGPMASKTDVRRMVRRKENTFSLQGRTHKAGIVRMHFAMVINNEAISILWYRCRHKIGTLWTRKQCTNRGTQFQMEVHMYVGAAVIYAQNLPTRTSPPFSMAASSSSSSFWSSGSASTTARAPTTRVVCLRTTASEEYSCEPKRDIRSDGDVGVGKVCQAQ